MGPRLRAAILLPSLLLLASYASAAAPEFFPPKYNAAASLQECFDRVRGALIADLEKKRPIPDILPRGYTKKNGRAWERALVPAHAVGKPPADFNGKQLEILRDRLKGSADAKWYEGYFIFWFKDGSVRLTIWHEGEVERNFSARCDSLEAARSLTLESFKPVDE